MRKKERNENVSHQTNKMGNAPLARLIITMSVPTMISMLIGALYNIVDSMFVAQLGEDALTAVSLVYPIQTLLLAVAVGTGVGVNSLVARRLGEGRTEDAGRAATHGVVLSVLSWLVFALVGLLGSEWFICFFSNNPDVVQMGSAYSLIVTTASFGQFISIGIEKIFQAAGQMLIPMLLQTLGAVVNIILDPFFIFGWGFFPEWGVTGAAVATVLGQIIVLVVYCFILKYRQCPVQFQFRRFRFSWRTVCKIYAVGFPAIIMQSIFSVVVTFFNAILAGFSQSAVSVLGVYFKLQSFVFMPIFGLSQGIMPIMGYNYGARNIQRLNRTIQISIALSCGVMAVGMCIFFLFPAQLLQLFQASDTMLAIGIPALRTVAVSFCFAGVDIVMATFFQAVGMGGRSLFISVLRQIFFLLPLAWIFAKIGLNWVWVSFPISEAVSLAICLVLFFSVYKKHILPLNKAL